MERLGKYEIRSTLGRGAMGTVYEGWDPVISRRVAIKTVRLPDSDDSEEREMLGRFKQEAQAAGRLQHANIVGVFDYAETDDLAYIVMEFVSGTTLKAIIEAAQRPDVTESARLMDGLLSGLAYSHGNGVIHRDIKPANVMVTPDGQVKIADFGIARIESSTMTQAGMIMGTPAYMSPEQFQGEKIDQRTDLYSAGVVLFQLLTGKRPFEGNMATIMHAVLNSPAPRPSDMDAQVSPALDAVVAKAMARDVEDRYPTATAFNHALQAALKAPPGTVPGGLDHGLGDLLGDEATVIRPARTEVPSAVKPAAKPAHKPTKAAPSAKKSAMPLVLAGIGGVVLLGAGGAFWAMSGGSGVSAVRIATQSPVASTPVSAAPVAAAPVAASPVVPMPVAAAPVAAPPVAQAPVVQTPPPVATPAVPTAVTPPALVTEPSSRAPEPAPPVAVAVVPPSPDAIRRAVATSLRSASCSFASGDDYPAHGLTLTGVAGRGAGETALRNATAEAAPGVAFDWRVAPVDGPYCSLLDTLRPYARPFASTARTLGVTLAGGRTDLFDKDLVKPRVEIGDAPANLQLDYIASDGSVLHMHESKPGAPYAADASPSFGEPRTGFKGWEIAEPFGTDLIVAVSSTVPLFRTGKALPETVDDYVRELRAAIDQAVRSGARVSAFVLPIHTAPRR